MKIDISRMNLKNVCWYAAFYHGAMVVRVSVVFLNDIDMDKAEKRKIISQLKEEAVDEITAMFNCRQCERFGHCDIIKLKGCDNVILYFLGFGSGILHALGDADEIKNSVKEELNKK